MKNPLRTNLILAVLLIVLGSAAYWYEFQGKAKRTQEEEAKTKLIALDPAREVESVKVFDQEQKIALEISCKQNCKMSDPNAQFEIISPIQFKADEGNVGTFITSIAASMVQESIPIEGDAESVLKGYGLAKEKRDQQKVIIQFKGDAKPYTIYIGDNSAVGENMYVYLDAPSAQQAKVLLIPAYIKNNMQRGLSYWRDKRLFHFATSEVEGLELSNQRGDIKLVREGENWFIQSGARQMADNETVDTFLTGLAFMNVHEYLSDDKIRDRAKLAIPAKPTYVLTIKLAKRPGIKFELFDTFKEKQPKLYGMLSDKNFIVEIDRTSIDKFNKKPESFRFKNLLTAAEKQQIRKIDLKLGAKESLQFQSDGTGWKLISGKIDSFDPASVEVALTKIGAARIEEFKGKAAIVSASPELSSWSLKTDEGKILRSFTIFGSVEKGNYSIRLMSGETALLERGSGGAVPSKIADFQKH